MGGWRRDKEVVLKKLRVLWAVVVVFGCSVAARAQGVDPPTRLETYHAEYEVNADGSHTETHKWSMAILKEEAVARSKQAGVSFSTSIQKGEILEAYTRKKDGRRLDVPKDNYQVSTNKGREAGSPIFSDFTNITVVFPDVEVGDAVGLAYRIVQTEPMFPGHFSVAHTFSKYFAVDEARIKVSAPAGLWTQHEALHLTAAPVREDGGRRVWEWTFRNPVAEKWTPEQAGIFTVAEQPGVYFSTFKSYAQLVEAYGVRARPKAAVTDRVRKLAQEVSGAAKTPRDQARALYEWITRNITYSGNCIGVGAVVPHDIDAILDNRMGDCKDRATLLQALLSARGIPSVQALINAGELYELPRVPVVSSLNHVINYLPGLDLYVDATSNDMPFGMLPMAVAEKPVLHVDGYADGRKTPHTPHQPNTQHAVTRYVIGADGSASGETKVTLGGQFAVAGRSPFRRLAKSDEEQFVKSVLSNFGQGATGSLTRDDATTLLDTYSYSVTFSLQELMATEGSGGLRIYPGFFSPQPVADYAESAKQPEPVRNQRCWGGHSTEEYTYEFPKALKILSVPKDVDAKSELLSYRATYRLDANVLTVRRVVDDTTPTNTCTPAQMAEFKKQARLIAKDVASQVIFEW
jgi:transglutaminase-like putative cysteine protease